METLAEACLDLATWQLWFRWKEQPWKGTESTQPGGMIGGDASSGHLAAMAQLTCNLLHKGHADTISTQHSTLHQLPQQPDQLGREKGEGSIPDPSICTSSPPASQHLPRLYWTISSGFQALCICRAPCWLLGTLLCPSIARSFSVVKG